MSYYEFTVQIYGGEETAIEMFEHIKAIMEDEHISHATSVLWKMDRVVIK